MRTGIHLLGLCLIGLFTGACQSGMQGGQAWATPAPTGATYRSKLGNFTCQVPFLLRPGARQIEQADVDSTSVAFSDDMGSLLRIESERIPAESREIFEGDKMQRTLDNCFDKSIMPQAFARVSAETQVLRREHLETAAGKALFVVVNIPAGSTLASADPPNAGRHFDSVRGTLIFARQGFLYVVMNQERPVSLTSREISTLQPRTDRLLAELRTAVASMTFQ